MTITTQSELVDAALALVGKDEGEMWKFDNSIRHLTRIFRANASIDLPEYDRIVGHSGLNGEWMNGLGVVFSGELKPHISDEDEDFKEGTLEDAWKIAVDRRVGRSQLSLGTSPEGNQKDFKETTQDAYERCAIEFRDWLSKQTGMSAETREEADNALNQYESSLKKIRGTLEDVEAYFLSARPA